jgi:hypothetical protein
MFSAQLTHVRAQRFGAGNMHITSCPVTRSLHFSRVNVTFRDDWGSVEEIVEEELPQVSGSVSLKHFLLIPQLRHTVIGLFMSFAGWSPLLAYRSRCRITCR